VAGNAFLAGNEGIQVDVGAGEPDDCGCVLEVQLLSLRRCGADAVPQFLFELGAAILYVEDFREFTHGLINGLDLKGRLARAIAADKIVLADAVGGHRVDIDAKFVELLAGSHAALGADMDLELGDDQLWLLCDDALETRMIVGKTLYLGVRVPE